MDSSRKFTKEQIDKLTFGIETLDHEQRGRVRDRLRSLLARTGGTLYRQSTHLELLKMKNDNDLSEIDLENLEDALFG